MSTAKIQTVTAPPTAAATPAAPGRTLHMVDLENLIGDPVADADVALAVFTDYLFTVGWSEHDHVLMSANAHLMKRIVFDLPLPMNVTIARRGRDGAERSLVSKVTPAFVARRYQRLAIGSGDGFFTEFASAARAGGCDVVVVSRRGSVNWRLYKAVDRHLVLTDAAAPHDAVAAAQEQRPPAVLLAPPPAPTAAPSRPPAAPAGETTSNAKFLGIVARSLGKHLVRLARTRLGLHAHSRHQLARSPRQTAASPASVRDRRRSLAVQSGRR